MGEYRLLDSQELGRGGFLTLVEERFAAPDGEEFTRWAVLHPGAVAAIWAPAPAYSASVMAEPTPAPDSTTTVTPWCTSSATPSGVTATRYSASLVSRGTPTTSGLGRGAVDPSGVLMFPRLPGRPPGGTGSARPAAAR